MLGHYVDHHVVLRFKVDLIDELEEGLLDGGEDGVMIPIL